MIGEISAGLGLLTSIFGGELSNKRQKDIINQMSKINRQNLNRQIDLAMPYYSYGQQGLRLANDFTSQMNRERFEPNKLYEQERNAALIEANRVAANSKKGTSYAFGSNKGRARGEEQRIGRSMITTKNNINMTAAEKINSDQMNKTQQYLRGMTFLNQAGYTGTNIMSNAYNNYYTQQMQLNGMQPINTTVKDIGGALLGYGLDRIGLDTAYKNYSNMSPMTGTQSIVSPNTNPTQEVLNLTHPNISGMGDYYYDYDPRYNYDNGRPRLNLNRRLNA